MATPWLKKVPHLRGVRLRVFPAVCSLTGLESCRFLSVTYYISEVQNNLWLFLLSEEYYGAGWPVDEDEFAFVFVDGFFGWG